MALNENQMIELSNFYMEEYNLKEEDYNNLKEVLRKRRNNYFYIYRYIAFVKDFLKNSKDKQFTIEIPIREEYKFFKKLHDLNFFMVMKGRKLVSKGFENEVYILIDIYR